MTICGDAGTVQTEERVPAILNLGSWGWAKDSELALAVRMLASVWGEKSLSAFASDLHWLVEPSLVD